MGYKAGDNCEEQRRTGPLHFFMNAQVFLQDMKFCFFLFLCFRNKKFLFLFFKLALIAIPDARYGIFDLTWSQLKAVGCYVPFWMAENFSKVNWPKFCNYGHLLLVIIGYFYGIIHSINGVLLVLVTRKGP